MSEFDNLKNKNKSKIIVILFVFIFLSVATIMLFQMKFIQMLFNDTFKLSLESLVKTVKILAWILGGTISIVALSYFLIQGYELIPLISKTTRENIVLQKKIAFPHYRATIFLSISGIPREVKKTLEREQYETLALKYWDVISSISRTCKEVSFWISKHNNKVKLLFSVSAWNWFSKEKAEIKARNNALALKAAFRNKSPSIHFESTTISESNALFELIKKNKFGLTTSGIPMLKFNQTQIDRLINTFNSIPEDCFFVVSWKGIKKGFEKKNHKKFLQRASIINEYNEDFYESQKSGQSKVGVYAFSESQNGIHMILAAILSIWAGTQTFNVKKLNDSENRRHSSAILKLSPIKNNRLSNKALSSFIHLPKEPYFTRDTGQPIFEIPSNQEKTETQSIVIGDVVQNERLLGEFSLPLETFLFNLEIIGMIGRGKTYLVASIIEQLLDSTIGCLILDLKGEYAHLFINEPNVIVYTIGGPAPLGINLFEMDSDDDVQIVLALISEMLTIAGAPFSPTMQHIFETALQKVAKMKTKNLETFLHCLNKSAEKYTISMKTSYARDSVDAILNRLNYIFGGVNFEVFSALDNTIDFSKLDDGAKIILDFSEYLRRGASTASLFLVCNLILHLLSKHASQKGITNKLRYLVILEEAMYLIPKRFNLESTASIGYSEQNFIMGRSLGIGSVTIYQLWDSVSSVVHANSLTKILFRGEDIEKMQGAIKLTEEQFDYLAHLPDRYFILKSKILSGPALLKSKTLTRRGISDNKYKLLAQQKFQRNGLQHIRLTKNLIELRNEVFLKEKPLGSTTQNSFVDVNKYPLDFNENIWEWCINSCPVRAEFKNKKSDWIKKNICQETQINAHKLVRELTKKEDLAPLIEMINIKPQYLVNKILNYYLLEKDETQAKRSAYCTINLLLYKLQDQFQFTNAWKNRSLFTMKNYMKQINP